MIIAITGGRYGPGRKGHNRGRPLIPSTYQMYQFRTLLLYINDIDPISSLVHGDAIGTDQYVGKWAQGQGIHVVRYPVQTDIDGPWPRAGHNRNRRMLVDSRAQVLVCFPGYNGTRNCRETGLELDLTVYEWQGDREIGEFSQVRSE